MSKLIEVSEFSESVLRIDVDTLVKGYDGTELGPANEQAQALANRTVYLKEKLESAVGDIDKINKKQTVTSVNNETGEVTVTYETIGAAPEEHTHTPSDIETTEDAQFVSAKEKQTWNDKQTKLISGETLKTILGIDLLAEGDITISAKDITVNADQQFVSTTEKDTWNKKQDVLVSGKGIVTLHNKKLLGDGNITLTAKEVGADETGTADKSMSDHLVADDPHPQYLSQAKGNENYVSKSDGNKPNGYLKLDNNGYIPADISALYEVRYNIAENKEERLGIEKSKNLTIALQLDENRIYYLDSNIDPSIDENWKVGRSTEVSTVISVFNRSGEINAEAGDYNADQITETDDRLFVSPTEKTTWDSKQTKLVSGTNLKTVNNTTLLGEGNISITPSSIGAADETHTHPADDVETNDNKQFISSDDRTNWNNKQDALVSGKTIKTINGSSILEEGDISITPEAIGAAKEDHKHKPSDIETDSDNQFISEEEKATYAAKQEKLVSGDNLATVFGHSLLNPVDISLNDVDNLAEVISKIVTPGNGIKIALDQEKNTLTVSKTSDNSSVSLTIKEVNNVESDASYYFPAEKDNYTFLAYALKQVDVDTRYISVDYSEENTDITESTLPELTTLNQSYTLNMVGYPDYDYGTVIISKTTEDVNLVDITSESGTYQNVPVLTKETSSDGTIIAIGSDNVASCYPWKAFSKEFTASEQNNVGNYTYFCDSQNRNNLKNDVYIGFKSTAAIGIGEYRIQRVIKFNTGTTTSPTAWDLQGRNSDTEKWTTIESRKDQKITGGTDWLVYKLEKRAKYKQFRLLITDAESNEGRTGMTKLRFYARSTSAILGSDKNYYLPDGKGGLTKVANKANFAFDYDGFDTTEVPINVSTLNTIMPINVIAQARGNVTIAYKKVVAHITIHNPIKRYKDWEEVDKLNITSFYSTYDKNTMRFAVTTGNGSYFVFNNSSWERIGRLSADDDSAKILYTKGMTGAVIESITGAQWAKLTTLESADVEIGLAYAVLVNNKDDSKTPKAIQFVFDATTTWKKLGTEEVAIAVSGSKISFIPKTTGNYKFCYQFF